MKSLFLFSILMTTNLYAQNRVPFNIEGGTSYPSPASIHLAFTEESIAWKAAEVCGGKEKLEFISDIQINIQNGLREGRGGMVARLDSQNPNFLQLWYPRIDVSAVAVCK